MGQVQLNDIDGEPVLREHAAIRQVLDQLAVADGIQGPEDVIRGTLRGRQLLSTLFQGLDVAPEFVGRAAETSFLEIKQVSEPSPRLKLKLVVKLSLRHDAPECEVEFDGASLEECFEPLRASGWRIAIKKESANLAEELRRFAEEAGERNRLNVAANDLLIPKLKIRGLDAPSDHSFGFAVIRKIVRPALTERHGKRGCLCSPSCTPSALDVIRRLGWDIAQKDDFQFAYIHPELKRCGGRQYIDLTLDELLLQLSRGVGRQLRGMFLHN